jgi:hypothetical protein
MTNDRNRQAQELAVKVMKWVTTQHVHMDVAQMAFLYLAAHAIGEALGDQAAQDYARMLADLTQRHMPQDQEEKKFWNLMAEQLYDKPVRF